VLLLTTNKPLPAPTTQDKEPSGNVAAEDGRQHDAEKECMIHDCRLPTEHVSQFLLNI
jgi:hypothetical protein